jgi:geranylgeranyl transferase type-2 subunit beta
MLTCVHASFDIQMSWIDKSKLAEFISQCQGVESFSIPSKNVCGGGIADRPGNMVDIFHTFFGISGLSLLGYFDNDDWNVNGESVPLPKIDPTYALPEYLVEKLGLPAQKLAPV